MACVKEGEAFLVMAAARVETARRAAGRRNRDMAGGLWKKINAGGFLFFFFSACRRALSQAGRLLLLAGESSRKQRSRERRVGGLRWFRMVYFGVGISFSEGISGAGKKIPKLACQPIGAAKLFFSLVESSQLVVQGLCTALGAPPNRGTF